ncbi:MAG: DNA repair protein RecN [Nitrospira sp.]|nr:DNA repair protein RecN [Nitrospira sp.]MCP9465603.1 DNA repair protein RecN [Nitrospira sp.]
MLTALRISNFAILEQLEITIEPGFTVLTGETGAGKSLLIDAIELLVGGRASSDQIRFGEEEATVEAVFEIPPDLPLLTTLREQGVLGAAEHQLVVRRIISRSGRNRVYLNGVMSPVHALEVLGGTLVDIHGQHDQQSLLRPALQLEVLDAFGRLQPLRNRYEEQYREWMHLRQVRETLVAKVQEASQREDYLTFQQRELEEAALRVDEEELLQSERRRLGAIHRLSELTAEAQGSLVERGGGVLPILAVAERALGEMAKLDDALQEPFRLLSEAKVLVREVADRLRDYASRLEADPGRLAAIEDRLALIQRLKKKYGGTVEAVVEAQRRIREELAHLHHADDQLVQCDRQVHERRVQVVQLADELSQKRRETARRMTHSVRQELDALKMGDAEFRIELQSSEQHDAYGVEGRDRVEFLFSANKGEPPKPLSRIASGGELSRVMLALKSALAGVDRVPVIIFDEIDAGVGGAAAGAIGRRLKALGRCHQVLCVTHLPQVASQADHHWCLEKAVVNGRTTTVVRLLKGNSREREIARMLAGDAITKKVRATAAELISGANE